MWIARMACCRCRTVFEVGMKRRLTGDFRTYDCETRSLCAKLATAGAASTGVILHQTAAAGAWLFNVRRRGWHPTTTRCSRRSGTMRLTPSCSWPRFSTAGRSNSDEKIDVTLYGQELMPSAFALGKAELLIQGGRPDAIKQGNTLVGDLYDGQTFDCVLSNSPFSRGSAREGKHPTPVVSKAYCSRIATSRPNSNPGESP
ncbi:MAG: N-6 DNA methylase [Homoserinimonas sp.]